MLAGNDDSRLTSEYLGALLRSEKNNLPNEVVVLPLLGIELLCRLRSRRPTISRIQRDKKLSTPGRIRTSNLRFRRPAFYPIELRVLVVSIEKQNSNQPWSYRKYRTVS